MTQHVALMILIHLLGHWTFYTLPTESVSDEMTYVKSIEYAQFLKREVGSRERSVKKVLN